MSIKGQGHFFTIYFPGFECFVLSRPRYQVSVYRTIGPLVCGLSMSIKHTKNLIKMTEQTMILVTHNPSFNHLVYIMNQIPGHRMQKFLKYPSLSHFPI